MTSFKHEKYKIKSKRPNTKLPYLRVCGVGRVCEWYGKPSSVQGMDPIQRKLLLLFVTILEKISYIRRSSINIKMTVQLEIEKKWCSGVTPDSNFLLPENDVQDKSHEMPKGAHLYWNTKGASTSYSLFDYLSFCFLFFNYIKFQK